MKLSIIILNYNTKKLLIQTLKSISPKLSHEIIVVDNASTDGSTQAVTNQFPDVILIKSTKNLGFAAGNNLGLKKAKGQYLLLLNSDTQVVGDALEKAVNYLDENLQVGLLTPKLLLPDGAIDLSCHRGFPTPVNSLLYFSRLSSRFPNSRLLSGYHQTYQNFDQIHPIDVISGAAMFIRRQVIDQIGFLDERFFMYAEDIDFCLRAHQAGWQTMYFPEAVIIHHKGASGSKHANLLLRTSTRAHFYNTMKQYFSKHYRYPPPIRFLINTSIDLVHKLRG